MDFTDQRSYSGAVKELSKWLKRESLGPAVIVDEEYSRTSSDAEVNVAIPHDTEREESSIWSGDTVTYSLGFVKDLRFSPNEDHLAWVENDGRVVVFDVSSRSVIWQSAVPLEGAHPDHERSFCLAFSPDGSRLAIGTGWNTTIWLFNLKFPPYTNEETLQSSQDWKGCGSLAFSHDGLRLVCGYYGGISIFDLTKKNRPEKLVDSGRTEGFYAIAASPVEPLLVTTTSDMRCTNVYNIDSAALMRSLPSTSIAWRFSRNGQRLFGYTKYYHKDSRDIEIWDTIKWICESRLWPTVQGPISHFDSSQKNMTMAVGYDGGVTLVHIDEDDEVLLDGYINSWMVSFSSSGLLAFCNSNPPITIWDTKKRRSIIHIDRET